MKSTQGALTTWLTVAMTVGLVGSSVIGCKKRTFGLGVGRPPLSSIGTETDAAATRRALAIREVFLADVDGATGPAPFAELHNTGTASIDLSDLELTSDGTTTIALTSAGTLEADQRGTVEIGTLNLVTTAGELAVRTAGGTTVHGYVAWGSDPALFDSVLYVAAVNSGATVPGSFIPLAYPLVPASTDVAAANEADLQVGCTTTTCGCAAPSATTAATIDASCPTRTPMLTLSGARATTDSNPNSEVTITNGGATAINLLGTRLCQGAICTVITQNVSVAASGSSGDTVRVLPGVTAPDNPAATDIYIPAPAGIGFSIETDGGQVVPVKLYAPGSTNVAGGGATELSETTPT